MIRLGKVLSLQVCLLLQVNLLFAQDHIVHGYVHAFDSIPLIGAEVYVNSTRQSVATDSLGKFMVFCEASDKLKIRAHGFATQNVKIKKEIKIVAVNLQLKQSAKQREIAAKHYSIGYGLVAEKGKTTATESLSKHEASFSRYANMYDLLQGQFSGVEVTSQGIIIRGTNSLNSSSAALIVVDGVIMESDILNVLRPVEIKDVHIIKDGSAAVYGSRGANGVVEIVTRKGGDLPQ